MRREKRLQQKRQRKAKRVEKKESRRFEDSDFRPADLMRMLSRARLIPKFASDIFPGSCHPSVDRPDMTKLEYAEWIRKTPQWYRKQRDLERRMSNGPMDFAGEIDHWAMEEFMWHGLPEDSENPLDTWLNSRAEKLPVEAVEQIRLWKQARPGIFEIGDVRNDLVSLRPCRADGQRSDEPAISAISLNIGGVSEFAAHRGKLLFTYLAPWNAEKGISCALGYSLMAPKHGAAHFILMSNLNDPATMATPWPWKQSAANQNAMLSEWKKRDWYGYLKERVEFPFQAVANTPSGQQIFRIKRIVDSTAEKARVNGVYFDCDVTSQVYLIGGTCLVPVDLGSRNAQPFAEYRAFRDIVGPPPASKGKPEFMYEQQFANGPVDRAR